MNVINMEYNQSFYTITPRDRAQLRGISYRTPRPARPERETQRTRVVPFDAPMQPRWEEGRVKSRFPKRTFTSNAITPVMAGPPSKPTLAVPLLEEEPHYIVEFPGTTYRISNVKYVSDIYKYIRYRRRQFVMEMEGSMRYKFNRILGRREIPFSLYYRGKLIRDIDMIPLEFNIPSGARLQVVMHVMMGGSSMEEILLPTYSHVAECEQQVIEQLVVQSLLPEVSISDIMSSLKNMFPAEGQGPFFLKLVEDVLLLMQGLVRSKTKVDYTIALITFVKLRMDGPLFSSRTLSLFTEKFQEVFDNFQVQSVEETFSTLRDYLTYYETIKNSPVFAKLYKFMMYALSLSLFEKMGVTFDSLRYSKLEAEAIKRQYHMGADFVYTILDTMLFLCERGYQCMKTGSLDPIYHCGSSYQKWFDGALELKRQAANLSFPEAHGIDRHKYLCDLRDHIDQGESINKHAVRLSNYDKKLVGSILSDLKLLLDKEITKREAQKEREAPFSVLLYGGSSIGKSSLTAMMFSHYGKVFGLQTGSEYKYTRNANDEFWSGFNSSQWCVQLDDIAFMHPNKAQQGDPSVMEMLQVVNNVPFIPAQADLADKGRTPMRAKLVIATTNCADLNAWHYFQTPIAVNRRLPFVIEARVKPAFGRDDAPHMLDNRKTANVEGEYCNYWDFHIYKVVPADDKVECRLAKRESVCSFDDVNDFLAWFAKEAKHHARVQAMVQDSANIMEQIEVCKQCYRNTSVCNCAMNVQSNYRPTYRAREPDVNSAPPTWWEWTKYYIVIALVIFLNSDFFTFVSKKIFRTQMFENFLQRTIIADEDRMIDLRMHFGRMGEQVRAGIGGYVLVVHLVSTLVQAYAAYKATSWLLSFIVKPQPEFTPEGNVSSTIGSTPTPNGEERANVWHKDDFELTTFDAPPKSGGYAGLEHTVVCDMIGKNTVHLSSMCEGRTTPKVIRATCLGGHIYVCNNHGLPLDGELTIQFQTRALDTGITPNLQLKVAQSQILRIPERDLAFIQVTNVPVRKNISGLLPTSILGGLYKGTYVGLTKEGEAFRRNVSAIKKHRFVLNSDGVNVDTDGWMGTAQVPTVNGDCGSIMVAASARGPILLGIHFAGAINGNTVGMMPLTKADYDAAVDFFGRPVIESAEPLLNSPSTNHVIGELHTKSVFRYIEEGSANVYGSLLGFRAAPKSHVVPTCISDAVEARGYKVAHGKPVMRGWQPWRIAALEMVKPVNGMDTTILSNCVDGFVNDILTKLPQSELDEIMVYDDVTTLNGAPGVQYVDKINRNTSAGHPWKKSKKYFLEPLVGNENWPEGVVASEEVMDRVQMVIEGYQQGKRYMPIFTGHLKDEATKFSKIEAKKTRVFTGAPFDWSFVVRKYLLSFVRVMQRNKFIFEAAPGTNAQSLEWQEIRNHLTKFGEDGMVAGDYAAFDKSMPPCMILAAFDIIRRVCKAGGFSSEECRVVQGIAEDTAFPLVDFNGDLTEFFGSNPSGHPLTVIINCLANSLYMRYCWAVLSGDEKCVEFQNNVALITYGDDNALGVSRDAAFFNHTSIQSVLASVGVKYTMADKEAESVPFIHIDEVSFLKRTWRWDSDVQAYLAPLEEASIGKSLTRVVASKTVPPEKQAVDVLSAACREYFFYGIQTFTEKRTMLMEIADECELGPYVEDSTFPTWMELRDNFWNNSKHVHL